MLEEAKEYSKELLEDTKEVVLERFFSPMYFYFILSWIIYNWTFIYSFLFVESKELKKLKVDYLLSFYPVNSFSNIALNVWYVFLGPAISTFLFIWCFSILSELSYKRFEQYKTNKRTIKRLLDYEEKVKIAKEEREIRDQESDLPTIIYNDNKDFNEWLDSSQENVMVGSLSYSPSEVLYNTDYQSYKEALEEYNNQVKQEENNDQEN
ncbi:hypothetical protein GSF70_05815 [Flavobacteriaceae bacterium W22]|nr:hypothetical protein [Flavobacteriaceae bacterium W22]